MSPEARDTGVSACQSKEALAHGVQGCCVGLITTGNEKLRWTRQRCISPVARVAQSIKPHHAGVISTGLGRGQGTRYTPGLL